MDFTRRSEVKTFMVKTGSGQFVEIRTTRLQCNSRCERSSDGAVLVYARPIHGHTEDLDELWIKPEGSMGRALRNLLTRGEPANLEFLLKEVDGILEVVGVIDHDRLVPVSQTPDGPGVSLEAIRALGETALRLAQSR